MTTSAYKTGHFLGWRDARNGKQAAADRTWNADKRFGYSDGYFKGTAQAEAE